MALRLVRMLVGLAVVGPAAAAAAEFRPPTAAERAAALGDLADVPPAFRALLAPDADFEPIAPPQPGDWLSAHAEPGQTFAAFLADRTHRITPARRVLALQPLGNFSGADAPLLAAVAAYAAAFFQTETRILPAYPLGPLDFVPRKNPQTDRVQRLTSSVLAFLPDRLPDDAFCILGVTMDDLYPAPSWNYVFGQASLSRRVGVYSFARYDPDFFGQPRPDGWRDLMLRRGCKVLVHETGHMFGLQHCIHYSCVMNGSNHLAETDLKPLHLCPVCLRKLQNGTGADPVRRYLDLAAFYRRQGWHEEARWCDRQLAKAARAAPAPTP